MSGQATTTATGRPRWSLFVALAGMVAVIDRLTKSWLVGQLDPGESMALVGDVVRLTFVRNSGALFGMFQDSAAIFGLVSLAVVGAIVWYHGSNGRSTLLSVALGLLLGGAIGNLIDRLSVGYVVDFVDVGLGTLRFYTFNAADAAISVALLLLIVSAFLPAVRARRAPRAAADG